MRMRITSLATKLLAAAAILSLGLGLPFVAAQTPDPTPGATQKVREQNLDGGGAIRVHEQGTADVNVTNGSLNIGGAVSVTNFPATQNVFVTGGTLDAASLTPVAQFHRFNWNVEPGESYLLPFDTTLNAVTVIGASLREGGVTFNSPLAGGPIFSFQLTGEDGDGGGVRIASFAHPLPIDGVSFFCGFDAAETCHMSVTILTT